MGVLCVFADDQVCFACNFYERGPSDKKGDVALARTKASKQDITAFNQKPEGAIDAV
jgi:hypothetical protein